MKLSGQGAGIALYSAGVFLFSVNDALGKWLVGSYGVGELMMLRTLGAALVLLPLIARQRPDLDIRGEAGLHALRIACMALDAFCFYLATRTLPLADVMTFYLAAPLIITALSAVLLGERVGAFRWGAVLFGFCGVVIALRPSGAAISPGALVALLGATMFGTSITITRRLRRTPWLTLTAWQFAGAGAIGTALAPLGWVRPAPVDVGLMFVVGVASIGCFICITRSLSLAPASLLAPFQYASLVWAAIMGFLVWGDVPGPNVVMGSAVIVASGLAVFWHERIRGRSVAEEVAPVP